MRLPDKLNSKNIRSTTLKEFWGTEFNTSIYLWEGAKHNLTLSEIDKIKIPTTKDLFASNVRNNKAFETCKELYFKFSQVLVENLNEIHDLNLSVKFWRIVFGYWLYRHICIVYEKYSYLSKIDIDKTSIKLLDKDSFFIPNDHYQYVHCFCNDFGVQQLVSQYYYLFKNTNFPIIKKNYKFITDKIILEQSVKEKKNSIRSSLLLSKTILKKILSKLFKPKMVLLNVVYSGNILKKLLIRSRGQIQPIDIPIINISHNKINSLKRKKLINIDFDNEFEYFLVQTLYYCFPRIFIEGFRDYYDVFLEDIRKRKFTHIVSEGWLGSSIVSLYFAIAQNNQKKLIYQEHAAGGNIVKNSNIWIDISNANNFLTTGWNSNKTNVIQGGFSSKNISNYEFTQGLSIILFIGHIRFPYLMEFSSHASNSDHLEAIKVVKKFINLLPAELSDNFLLRPRRGNYFWDTEFALEVDKNKIMIDDGVFSNSILKSRIVIIDHISSGLSEILLMNAPFLLLVNRHTKIEKKYERIFDELFCCGVAHATPDSAVKQLSKIYDNPESWWKSEPVQTPINQLKSNYLASPSKTIDYLLSCLKN